MTVDLTDLVRRDLIRRAQRKRVRVETADKKTVGVVPPLRRALLAVAAGALPAGEVSRQMDGVFSPAEVEYLARRLDNRHLDLVIDLAGSGRRLWGPSGPVASRDAGEPVRASTAARAAAALEERVLPLLGSEPASLAGALSVAPATMRQTVYRVLDAIGLDSLGRAGRRQPRSDDDAPVGGTMLEQRIWQERRAGRDYERGRKRRQRAQQRAGHLNAWDRATDEQRAEAVASEQRRAERDGELLADFRSGRLDAATFERLSVENDLGSS